MDKNLGKKNVKYLFIIFAFIFLSIYFLAGDFLRYKSYNLMNKLTIFNKIASNDVNLVVVDDKSLNEIGRWPWKREQYLEIFNYFEYYTKAKFMAYDAIIVAPDTEHPKSDEKFFNKIKDYQKLTVGYAFSYDEFAKDKNKDRYNSIIKQKNKIKIIDKRTKTKKITSSLKSFTASPFKYYEDVKNIGVVNIPVDSDGYIRKAGHLIEYNGEFYPSLALVLYSNLTGIKEYVLTDSNIYGISQNYTLNIPIQNVNGFISNFICFYKSNDGIYSHKKYSASDIILSYRALKAGKKPIIDPAEFENKIIFIGSNANAQALSDVGRTPISETFAGVDIQATNFNNILKNEYFTSVNKAYDLLICLFVFMLVFLFVSVMPTGTALLSSVVTMILYAFFALFMFYNRIAIDLITPEVFIIVAIGCAYSYRYLVENVKKSKIQRAMGKYLSQEVMENVVKNIDNIEPGGKRANITVLFADIRNFTSISERLDASSVTTLLNEYFSAMVPIIEENNGVLNKFMGDAILAIFGEPKHTKNHALDAVRCANQMLKKVKYFQDKWEDKGLPRIEIGIGISTGEAFIGNIGSKDRLEYTVIGDTVNTASRIENYNKVYKTNFLISESTYNIVKSYLDVITINNVTIRGKQNKINLYEVVRVIDKA